MPGPGYHRKSTREESLRKLPYREQSMHKLKRKLQQKMKPNRLGGGKIPDVFNPRTKRYEVGRKLKPDRST